MDCVSRRTNGWTLRSAGRRSKGGGDWARRTSDAREREGDKVHRVYLSYIFTLTREKGRHFHVGDFEEMGRHFCEVLLEYSEAKTGNR